MVFPLVAFSTWYCPKRRTIMATLYMLIFEIEIQLYLAVVLQIESAEILGAFRAH